LQSGKILLKKCPNSFFKNGAQNYASCARRIFDYLEQNSDKLTIVVLEAIITELN